MERDRRSEIVSETKYAMLRYWGGWDPRLVGPFPSPTG